MVNNVGSKRFAGLSELECYWEQLRGDRIVPYRSEVDPRGLENMLEGAFILERVAKRVVRLRVAGVLLTEAMGLDVRGMPLTTMLTPGSRDILANTVEEVFDGPKTAMFELSAERGIGKPALEAQMMILPLRSDLGDISRAIGLLSTRGKIGRAPRRFDILATPVTRLLHGNDGAPRPNLQVMPQAPKPEFTPRGTPVPAGFAEARAEAPSPKPARRSHLRLVHSVDHPERSA